MSGDKHEEEGGEAPAKGGKLKFIIGAVLMLLVGAGAGVGGAMFLGGGASAGEGEEAAGGHGEEAAAGGHGEEPAAGGHGEEAAAGGHGEEPAAGGHGEPAAGGHGEEPAAGGHGGGGAAAAGPPVHNGKTVVNLGLFTVNLRGSGGGRVLRTEVQVEVPAGGFQVVETRKPVLRDAVITLASDFSYSDLEGVDGKTHLRDELQGRLNSVLSGEPKVERVYFTEFVVQ